MNTQLRSTSLGNMYSELQRQHRSKLDLIVPSNCISMQDGEVHFHSLPMSIYQKLQDNEQYARLAALQRGQGMFYDVSDAAFAQIADKLNIGLKFSRYASENHLDLWDYNVNKLMERAEKNYFVRNFLANSDDPEDNGTMRALLSDQFRVIDHLDVLGTTLEVIKDAGIEVQIGRCNLTEKSMYVEVISKDVVEHADDLLENYRSPRRDNSDGDNRIFAGFVISNSETGQGRYKVQPRALIGKCDNGLVFKADALAATHLGSKMSSGVLWAADTLETEVELVGKQTRDAVRTFISPEYLGRKIVELSQYKKPLEKPVAAVGNVCKTLSFSEERIEEVVTYFVQGGDDSPLGVLNSLTYYAQQVEDADMQYDIEEQAMDILPRVASLQYN